MTDAEAKDEAARRWGACGCAKIKQVRGKPLFIVSDGGVLAGSSVSWEAAFETAAKMAERVGE